MPKEILISLRFPEETHNRAQAVADRLRDSVDAPKYGRISKALVFRLAMLRGLEDLEREHGIKKGRKGRKR